MAVMLKCKLTITSYFTVVVGQSDKTKRTRTINLLPAAHSIRYIFQYM